MVPVSCTEISHSVQMVAASSWPHDSLFVSWAALIYLSREPDPIFLFRELVLENFGELHHLLCHLATYIELTAGPDPEIILRGFCRNI